MKTLGLNEEVVITGKLLMEHRDICRKEGALKELKKAEYRFGIKSVDGKDMALIYIQQRIKELEGEKTND